MALTAQERRTTRDPEREAEGTEAAQIRHAGGGWSICYDGISFVLPDFKGIGYLAHLLVRPGRELHVTDLISAVEGVAADCGSGRAVLDHAGEILDSRARAEYRARLEDLRSELEEAVASSDVGRADRLRAEMEFLCSELSAAYGLGGRARRGGDVAERARKAVRNRIRAAMAKIAKHAPALADHLDASVRTGMFCTYEPPRPVRWSG